MRKTYTAVHAAGNGGKGKHKDVHIAELYFEPGYGWLSKGLTLCDANAERNGRNIVAAQGKSRDDATCRVCRFTYAGIVQANQAQAKAKTKTARMPMPSARRRETAKMEKGRKTVEVQ